LTSASQFIPSSSAAITATPTTPNAIPSITASATGHISDHQNIMDALWYHDYYLSTSSGLRAAILDETGTGSLVFNTNPTISGTNITGTTTNSGFISGGSANFISASLNGVALTTSGGAGTASITIADEGGNLTTNVGYINFTGAGVTATGTSSVTVNIPGGGAGTTALTVQDNGTNRTTTASILNFAGSGASVSGTGGSVTVTIGSNTFNNATLSGSTTNSGSIINGTLLNSSMVGASTIGPLYMNANGFNDTVFYLNAPNGSQPYYVFQNTGANLWGMTVNATNTVDFQLRRMNGATFNAPAGGVLNWPTTPYAMTISGSTGAVVFPGNSLTIANAFTGAPQNQLPAIPPYAGTFEYDGTAGYFTPNITASSRGILPTELLTILAASVAVTNVANVNNNLFPSRNTITLAANTTYEMQMELWYMGVPSAGGAVRLGMAGTASPVGSFMSTFFDPQGASVTGNNSRGNANYVWTGGSAGVAGNPMFTTSSATLGQGIVVRVNGFLRNSSSGTFIPQIQFQAAPGSATYFGVNSFMKLIPIGASATTGTVAWF